MAETMILTLEGVFENYSIGGDICLEKVKRIAYLGEKHGFRLADFKSFGKDTSPEKIERLKRTVSAK
jgi:hypothetical protein